MLVRPITSALEKLHLMIELGRHLMTELGSLGWFFGGVWYNLGYTNNNYQARKTHVFGGYRDRKDQMTEAKKDEGLKIRIRLIAYDHRVIDQSAKQIVDTALRTGAKVSGPIPLPTKRSTFTVVKSPHVYKTGGEAFEMKVHKRLIDISNATPKTIESLQNLSLPAGVDAEIKM